LYDGLGFVDAGHATLMDALVANNEVLPEDGGASQPETYLAQSGLVLMKVTALDGRSSAVFPETLLEL
jgi:hypothetical protein